MDDFFETMTLTSYLQRLSDAQYQTAMLMTQNKMSPGDFIDWVRDPLEQWLEKHQYFSEQFPSFLIRELGSLINETVLDRESLRVIYKAYLSTLIENHTKTITHLLKMLKNCAFHSRDNSGRIVYNTTLIVDTLIHQAYQKRQMVNDWHPEMVLHEFSELFGERLNGDE